MICRLRNKRFRCNLVRLSNCGRIWYARGMQEQRSSVTRPGELSVLQKAFARAYVLNGGDAQAAAREAGYSEGGIDTIALRNTVKPSIVAEIKRLAVVELGSKLPEMIQAALDIALDPKVNPEIRARTLFNLMDRAGLAKQTGPAVQVNIQNNTSGGSSALIQEIWDSRAAQQQALAAHLSVIDGGMSDGSTDPDDPDPPPVTVEAQADPPTADHEQAGGVQLQGPARPPVS